MIDKGHQEAVDLEDRGLRTVVPIGAGAQVMTSSFPGLYITPNGGTVMMPDAMQTDLELLKSSGARLLLLLPEEKELPSNALTMVAEAADKLGMTCHCLPIADYNAPGRWFLDQWKEWRVKVYNHFDAGEGVAICCRYGAGRSGTVAAMLLIDSGLSARSAVETIREQFAPSVESDVQYQWLRGYAQGRSSRP